MDTNKDKAEFLNNFQKNSDSEDNEDVQWSQQDNFIENQSNLIKNNQINVPEHIQNTKGTALLNQEDIIPAFKKMNIRDTSTNKSKQRSKDLALNYYFGVGERPGNQNGNNEDPYELSSSNNKQSDSTYMQFNHNNFFQQTTVSQQQQPNLGLNSNNSNNNTQQINEQDIINEQQQQPTNFTSLLNMQNNSNNIISNIQSNNNNNNNTPQRAINTNNTNRLIEKYNVNSQPYIPKNKDLNYYKNPQLLQQPPDQHLQQLQSQIQPNADVDNQLYKLNLSKSSNIPGKFYVIKSVDEANIKRSISFNIWCSTIKGNQKLQKAFKESAQKYPIYLFFSVNGSGKFMGLAQMVSEVEYRVNFNYWSQNDKWKGFFFIRWIYIKDIPNKIFRNIINEYNDNKPVTSSRDTQEIFPSAGIEMYKIFKEYPQETSIFDQLSMEEKMAIMQSQQQGQINAQIQQQQMRLQQNKIGNINKQQQLQQSQVPGMYNIPQHFQQQQNQNNLRNNLSQSKLNNNNNSNNNNMFMNQLNMQSIDMLNQMNMNNKSIGMNPHHNLIGHNGMNNPRINNPMNMNMGFGNMNLQPENQLVNQIPLMMQQLQKQQEQFKKMSMVGLNYNNSNNNNPSNTILGNISNNENE